MPTDRREWLIGGVASALGAGLAAAGTPATAASPRLSDPMRDAYTELRSLSDSIDALSAGRTSAERLVREHLRRIERFDRAGPVLRSVIETNPDALAIARRLDVEQRAGTRRGPLHGIPVLVKDNLATADAMQTTAGSLALVDSRPTADAEVVRRLREAGAVLLGKTNLSEWANIRGSHSTSGWSARGGLTRNPYVLDRSASGSSSGSAVAVAAGLCAAAIGTETDGSIVSPSAACGIVGLKPTVGLVSRRGIIPISSSQDTAGPMARSVRDAARLLDVIAGPDPLDPATAASPPGAGRYADGLDGATLKGARLGVVRSFFGFHEPTDRVYDGVLETLRRAGAILVDPVVLPGLETIDAAELTVLLTELKVGLDAYLGRLPAGAPVRTLADVIAFNERHAGTELRWFGQDLFVKAQATGGLGDPAYLAARDLCLKVARTDGIDAVIAEHRLDALIAPTGGPAWRTDLATGDHFLGGSSTPAAVAGTPSLTVPAGTVHGLPVGLSFFGKAWAEGALLRLGQAFEIARGPFPRPTFLPTIEQPAF